MRHISRHPDLVLPTRHIGLVGAESAVVQRPQGLGLDVLGLIHERFGNEGLAAGIHGGGELCGAAAETLSRALAGVDEAEWLRGGNRATQLRLQRGGGSPLPAVVAQRMEAVFGHDFSVVRIHTDAAAAEDAERIHARAFASGEHIYFSQGAWSPGHAEGDRLLIHELSHVVQHQERRLPTGGGLSRPTDPHEQEAVAAEDELLARLDALLAEGGGAWAAEGEPLLDGPEGGHPPDWTSSVAGSVGAAGPDMATEAGDLLSPSSEVGAEGAAAPAGESGTEKAPEATEGEEGASPATQALAELVRPFSPLLADLLEQGLSSITDQLQESVSEHLDVTIGGLDIAAMVNGFLEELGAGTAAVTGAAAGEQACCEALPGWIQGLQCLADGFLSNKLGGLLFKVMKMGVDGPLSCIGSAVSATVEGLLKFFAPNIKSTFEDIQEGIDTLRLLDASLADQIASALGLGEAEGGTLGLLADLWEQVCGAAFEAVAGVMQDVVAAFFALPGVEELYRVVDRCLDLIEGVQWLQAHWDDPNIVEKAHEEMAGTWVPGFVDFGMALVDGIKTTWATVKAGLSDLLALLRATSSAGGILPLDSL